MSSPFDRTKSDNDLDFKAVITSFVINFLLCSILILLFSVIRTRHRAVYEPKRKYGEDDDTLIAALDDGLFSWIRPLLTIDEDALNCSLGLDAIMILKFIRFGMKLLSFVSLFSVVLMFIHYSAGSDDIKSLNPSLIQISIENLPNGSRILYLHVLLCWLYSFLSFFLLYRIWNEYIELRQQQFQSPDYLNSFHSRILLFTEVPERLLCVKKFKLHLRQFGCEIEPENIMFTRDNTELQKLVKLHLKVTKKFENVLVHYLISPKQQKPKHYPRLWGESVNSIEYYVNALKELEFAIYSLQSQPVEYFGATSTCFVSFKDINESHLAAKELSNFMVCKQIPFLGYPNFKLCPDFRDLEWSYLGRNSIEKNSRLILTILITTIVTVIWVSIVSITQLIGNYITFVDQPIPHNWREPVKLLQSIVAPSLIAGLNILIFYVLRYIVMIQGATSKSGIERSALLKYFIFQIYQFMARLLVEAYKGWALLKSLSETDKLVQILSSNFVTSSQVFISYVTAGLTYYGFEISGILPMFYIFFLKTFFSDTPRRKSLQKKIEYFDYLPFYGFLITTFLLSLSYSLVAPLIVIFGALTFGLAYLVVKHQLLYVYKAGHSGGLYWPEVFNIVITTLGIFQLLTLGAMFVKQSNFQNRNLSPETLILAPLPFLTIIYWIVSMKMLLKQSLYLNTQTNSAPANCIDEHSLKDKVFDPVFNEMLPEVWVWDEQQDVLANYYTKQFKDLADFQRKEFHP